MGGIPGFGAVSGPSGLLIQGLNSRVDIVFSKNVDPSTVSTATVLLVSIDDPSGQASTPAGVLASYTLQVSGNRISILPTIEFGSQEVTFGFVADALYEISFPDPSTGLVIRSVAGKEMINPGQSYFFRTPLKAADSVGGYPQVRIFLTDDTDSLDFDEIIADENGNGSIVDEAIALLPDAYELLPPGGGVPTTVVPASPIRDMVLVFDDGILPQTILNSVDGSSPAVRVFINTAALPTFQPVTAPGELTFLHQQQDLTLVRWRSILTALPPGGFMLVQVTPDVQDLACNSKLSLTGDPTPLFSAPIEIQGGVDGAPYVIEERFVDDAQKDSQATSAGWGGDLLVPVLGGGRGVDGDLVVDVAATADDLGTTDVPLEARLDFDAKLLELPVVEEILPGVFEPRSWEFRRVRLPVGWTLQPLHDVDGDGIPDPDAYLVQSPGHPLDDYEAPLSLRATNSIDLAGTVRVGAGAGEVLDLPNDAGDPLYPAYLGQGGQPGRSLQAAGAGGSGGDVLLAIDALAAEGLDSVAVPLVSPFVPAPGALFNVADPKLRGVTGRSDALTATTLTDSHTDLSVLNTNMDLRALLKDGELRLQPNVGIGSSTSLNSGSQNQFIDENHPSFVIESVDVVGGVSTITIESGDGESMLQPSKNIATGFAPIAAAGDSYLIGRLHGRMGDDVASLDRGGQGAEPYVVVNEGAFGITTTGGGGGGGGGIAPGSRGDDSGPASDPNQNQRGTSGGMSLDDSHGADGGFGAARGTVLVVDDTQLDVVTQTTGRPLAELAGPALVGSRLVPNAPNDGWVFTIEAFDGTTFVVSRIQIGMLDIGLTSGPAGVSGPGLSGGMTVPFLVLPPAGIGGAGGGGSGVSLTGTINVAPSVLPILAPGAGGGSGGGVLELESAQQIVARDTAVVRADGGAGGSIADVLATRSGGGGGSGGSVALRAGKGFQLFQGARFSVAGGPGGGVASQGRGGDGGAGWLRVENFADSLAPGSFLGFTVPTLQAENVGRLIGRPQSVGQSRYYASGVANPEYESLTVTYDAVVDGVARTGLKWRFDMAGITSGGDDFPRPPFEVTFNPATVDLTGFIDVDAASPTFYGAYDLISGRAGLVYDPVDGVLLFSVGEGMDLVHCLGACNDVALPDIPGVDATQIDIVSMALGGADRELFLLQRGTGLIFVLGRDGAYRRTITLPRVLEGALAFVPGVVPADDRLVVAENRADLLATFPPRDDSGDPMIDLAPVTAVDVWNVSRDGVFRDIEITGLAHDAASGTLWCVEAATSLLYQVDLTPGSEGTSVSGVHAFSKLTAGGFPAVPSTVTFDGSNLQIVRSVSPSVTSLFAIDPATVSTTGVDLVLGSFGSPLPEIARSIGDGDIFLRFRIALNGDHDDLLAPGGPVSFRNVAVDTVEIVARNLPF